MKRISIITWYCSNNFGTSLQAFALQKHLSNLGYDVEMLNHFLLDNSLKSILKRTFGLLGLLKFVRFFRFVKKINLYIYVKNEINEKCIFTEKQYHKMLKETDVFIAGSDQIWNCYYRFDPFYFLDFAENKKCIAYASSIGTNSVAPQYSDKVRDLLVKFSSIGVREKTAIKVLSDLTGRNDIRQVLDPTFLLKVDCWKEFGNGAILDFDIPETYIFCYLIGDNEEYSRQLKDVINKSGIGKVVIIPSIENPQFNLEGAIVYKNAGPKEFIHLIERCSLVCTDSFHASALSINMSKKFVVFKRFGDNEIKSQNSRLYDLLSQYKLMDRFYSSDDGWQNHIDYDVVQTLLIEDRMKSNNFLVNAIES